jgi:hypothetical protein
VFPIPGCPDKYLPSPEITGDLICHLLKLIEKLKHGFQVFPHPQSHSEN